MSKKSFLSVAILIVTTLVFQTAHAVCETDLATPFSYGQARSGHSTETLKLLVWNVLKFKRDGVLTDLQALGAVSDLTLMQEGAYSIDLEKDLLGILPNFQQVFYPSFCDDSQTAFGVQINSKFSVSQAQNWPAPDAEPFSTIHKMTGYAQVMWNGEIVHVINTHALNFNAGGPFERQIDDVYEKIKDLKGPVIWAGDFNTWNFWSDGRLEYLVAATEDLGLKQVEFKEDTRKLKLDHIFYRGFKLKNSAIVPVSTSDHNALVVEFEIPKKVQKKIQQKIPSTDEVVAGAEDL